MEMIEIVENVLSSTVIWTALNIALTIYVISDSQILQAFFIPIQDRVLWSGVSPLIRTAFIFFVLLLHCWSWMIKI